MLIVWFLSIKSLPNLLFRVLCLPGDQSHPVCATVNKPSCVLHLLGWFIGSRGFSSLEWRPEFGVLQNNIQGNPHKTVSWFFQQELCRPEGSDGREYNQEYPAKLVFQIWWGNQKLYRKAKPKRIQDLQATFSTNIKGIPVSRKEKPL